MLEKYMEEQNLVTTVLQKSLKKVGTYFVPLRIS